MSPHPFVERRDEPEREKTKAPNKFRNFSTKRPLLRPTQLKRRIAGILWEKSSIASSSHSNSSRKETYRNFISIVLIVLHLPLLLAVSVARLVVVSRHRRSDVISKEWHHCQRVTVWYGKPYGLIKGTVLSPCEERIKVIIVHEVIQILLFYFILFPNYK